MASEIVLPKIQPHQTVWSQVIVTGLVESNPPQFGFYMTLTLRDGKKRRCQRSLSITEEAMLQRLRTEVKPGDEIKVCIETDWGAEDIPSILKDFHFVSSTIR